MASDMTEQDQEDLLEYFGLSRDAREGNLDEKKKVRLEELFKKLDNIFL